MMSFGFCLRYVSDCERFTALQSDWDKHSEREFRFSITKKKNTNAILLQRNNRHNDKTCYFFINIAHTLVDTLVQCFTKIWISLRLGMIMWARDQWSHSYACWRMNVLWQYILCGVSTLYTVGPHGKTIKRNTI